MQIYTQVVGDKEVLKKLLSLMQKCDETVKNIVRDATLKAEGTAKKEVNVDTGRLRSSITHEFIDNKNEHSGIVGTNVHYAPYQEFGAHGKPYLYPGLKAGTDLMIKKLKSEIKKIKP